jgi:hypothetical protein
MIAHAAAAAVGCGEVIQDLVRGQQRAGIMLSR